MTARSFGGTLSNAVLKRVGRAASRVQEKGALPVDVLESADEYLVVFDAPGATPSDVRVTYEDGGVEVRVERFRGVHDGFALRFPGRGLSLHGRVELPEGAHVNDEEATATLRENGTLHVVLPKITPAVRRVD